MGEHPTPHDAKAIWPKGGPLLPQPELEEIGDVRLICVVQATADRDAKPSPWVVGHTALDVELCPFPEKRSEDTNSS